MARGTPRPSPAISSIPQAIQGGAIGWILGQLNNSFIPLPAAMQNVYGAFPGLGVDDIAALIEMAREQRAAGEAFGTGDIYRRPTLAEIPICPGCPANKVEVTIRVRILSDTEVDSSGQPIELTHGIVSCVENHIPTADDIRRCAERWSDFIQNNHFQYETSSPAQYDVVSAQRGPRFGG